MAQEFSKKKIEDKLKEASQSIEKTSFINQDISNKQLRNLTLKDQVFKNCNFYVTSMYGCNFDHCDFIDCNFNSVDFLNVKFFTCIFNKCEFDNAKMQDVLMDDCIKINCSMTNLHLYENVVGINIEESNIVVEEDTNKFGARYEYLKEENGAFVHVSLDQDSGTGVYRVIIGDSKNPSIISDTTTETNPIKMSEFIKELIDIAIDKVNDKLTKQMLKNLQEQSYDDIFDGQLQEIKQQVQSCIEAIDQYPITTNINLIYNCLINAIEELKPLVNEEN